MYIIPRCYICRDSFSHSGIHGSRYHCQFWFCEWSHWVYARVNSLFTVTQWWAGGKHRNCYPVTTFKLYSTYLRSQHQANVTWKLKVSASSIYKCVNRNINYHEKENYLNFGKEGIPNLGKGTMISMCYVSG